MTLVTSIETRTLTEQFQDHIRITYLFLRSPERERCSPGGSVRPSKSAWKAKTSWRETWGLPAVPRLRRLTSLRGYDCSDS